MIQQNPLNAVSLLKPLKETTNSINDDVFRTLRFTKTALKHRDAKLQIERVLNYAFISSNCNDPMNPSE